MRQRVLVLAEVEGSWESTVAWSLKRSSEGDVLFVLNVVEGEWPGARDAPLAADVVGGPALVERLQYLAAQIPMMRPQRKLMTSFHVVHASSLATIVSGQVAALAITRVEVGEALGRRLGSSCPTDGTSVETEERDILDDDEGDGGDGRDGFSQRETVEGEDEGREHQGEVFFPGAGMARDGSASTSSAYPSVEGEEDRLADARVLGSAPMGFHNEAYSCGDLEEETQTVDGELQGRLQEVLETASVRERSTQIPIGCVTMAPRAAVRRNRHSGGLEGGTAAQVPVGCIRWMPAPRRRGAARLLFPRNLMCLPVMPLARESRAPEDRVWLPQTSSYEEDEEEEESVASEESESILVEKGKLRVSNGEVEGSEGSNSVSHGNPTPSFTQSQSQAQSPSQSQSQSHSQSQSMTQSQSQSMTQSQSESMTQSQSQSMTQGQSQSMTQSQSQSMTQSRSYGPDHTQSRRINQTHTQSSVGMSPDSSVHGTGATHPAHGAPSRIDRLSSFESGPGGFYGAAMSEARSPSHGCVVAPNNSVASQFLLNAAMEQPRSHPQYGNRVAEGRESPGVEGWRRDYSSSSSYSYASSQTVEVAASLGPPKVSPQRGSSTAVISTGAEALSPQSVSPRPSPHCTQGAPAAAAAAAAGGNGLTPAHASPKLGLEVREEQRARAPAEEFLEGSPTLRPVAHQLPQGQLSSAPDAYPEDQLSESDFLSAQASCFGSGSEGQGEQKEHAQTHSPPPGSPRMGSPQMGSPKMGSPRLGLERPRMGSPPPGSPRLDSSTVGSPRVGSPTARPLQRWGAPGPGSPPAGPGSPRVSSPELRPLDLNRRSVSPGKLFQPPAKRITPPGSPVAGAGVGAQGAPLENVENFPGDSWMLDGGNSSAVDGGGSSALALRTPTPGAPGAHAHELGHTQPGATGTGTQPVEGTPGVGARADGWLRAEERAPSEEFPIVSAVGGALVVSPPLAARSPGSRTSMDSVPPGWRPLQGQRFRVPVARTGSSVQSVDSQAGWEADENRPPTLHSPVPRATSGRPLLGSPGQSGRVSLGTSAGAPNGEARGILVARCPGSRASADSCNGVEMKKLGSLEGSQKALWFNIVQKMNSESGEEEVQSAMPPVPSITSDAHSRPWEDHVVGGDECAVPEGKDTVAAAVEEEGAGRAVGRQGEEVEEKEGFKQQGEEHLQNANIKEGPGPYQKGGDGSGGVEQGVHEEGEEQEASGVEGEEEEEEGDEEEEEEEEEESEWNTMSKQEEGEEGGEEVQGRLHSAEATSEAVSDADHMESDSESTFPACSDPVLAFPRASSPSTYGYASGAHPRVPTATTSPSVASGTPRGLPRGAPRAFTGSPGRLRPGAPPRAATGSPHEAGGAGPIPTRGAPRVHTESPQRLHIRTSVGGGPREGFAPEGGRFASPDPAWRGGHERALAPIRAGPGGVSTPTLLPVPGTPKARAASPGRLSHLATHRPFVYGGGTPGADEGAPRSRSPLRNHSPMGGRPALPSPQPGGGNGSRAWGRADSPVHSRYTRSASPKCAALPIATWAGAGGGPGWMPLDSLGPLRVHQRHAVGGSQASPAGAMSSRAGAGVSSSLSALHSISNMGTRAMSPFRNLRACGGGNPLVDQPWRLAQEGPAILRRHTHHTDASLPSVRLALSSADNAKDKDQGGDQDADQGHQHQLLPGEGMAAIENGMEVLRVNSGARNASSNTGGAAHVKGFEAGVGGKGSGGGRDLAGWAKSKEEHQGMVQVHGEEEEDRENMRPTEYGGHAASRPGALEYY